MLDTVVMSGDDVCCSVVFGTLVGVFVFSVMWSELLMTSDVVLCGHVCCSVVFGTLVGVFVFSVMWSELLMTSAISCPLWSSVYECQRVECALCVHISGED